MRTIFFSKFLVLLFLALFWQGNAIASNEEGNPAPSSDSQQNEEQVQKEDESQATSTSEKRLNPSWDWQYFKFALGAEYLSNLSDRGATFYPSFQFIPIFALDLFTPHLQIVGLSLRFQHRITPWLRIRSHLLPSTPSQNPLYETGKDFDETNERETTTEWIQYLELGNSEKYGEFRLAYAQDLRAHKGVFLETQARYSPYQFELWGRKLQPSVFVNLGFGESNFNQHFYGAGAADSFGPNVLKYGFQLTAAPVIDHFFPIIEFSRYQILRSSNQNASLVDGDDRGFQVIALIAFNIVSHSKNGGWKFAFQKAQ